MSGPATLATASLLGLFSSLHCLGMCGGIMAALGSRARGPGDLLLYQVGRVTSYALVGLLAGSAGAGLMALAPGLGPWLRGAAGLLLIAMGLYLMGRSRALLAVERLGARMWNPLQRRFRALGLDHPFATGLVWGWLPCGLVYSVAAWALLSGSAGRAATIMVAFGVGTLPAALAAGGLFAGLVRQPMVRQASGALVVAFGCWTLVMGLPGAHGGAHGALGGPPAGAVPSFDIEAALDGSHRGPAAATGPARIGNTTTTRPAVAAPQERGETQ